MTDAGLFDMEPVILRMGDEVIAHTVWGDEVGTLVGIDTLTDNLHCARVEIGRGELLVSLARLTRR